MSLYSMLKGRGPSGFGYGSTAEEVTDGLDLHGKTVLITGINSGLGQETARVLAMRGARILGTARTNDKATQACAALPNEPVPLTCELSEPESVRACVDAAAEHGPIDVIVGNAGIMALPKRTLAHGHELQFLTNHIGHFMLVTGLLPQLAEDARVVMLSSSAHAWAPKTGIAFGDLSFERKYNPTEAYGQSKLANLLFARSLAKRFEGTPRTANALHPGVIATNLMRHMSGAVRMFTPLANALVMKSIPQGAATQCYVATHPSLATVSGEYFVDCNIAQSSTLGQDLELAERLWSVTEEIAERL